MPNGDHPEQAVGVIVWACGEEELVVRCGWAAVESELKTPGFVNLDRLVAFVSQWTEECARRRVECIDPASRSVVADQNRIAHRTEIGRCLSQTPWRMEWTVGGEVLLQGTVEIEYVYETALRFVQRGVGDPDFVVDILNTIWREVPRDVRIVKGRHSKSAVEPVNPPVRAIIGGVQESITRCCVVAMAKPV